jgi:hypothetical protein
MSAASEVEDLFDDANGDLALGDLEDAVEIPVALNSIPSFSMDGTPSAWPV